MSSTTVGSGLPYYSLHTVACSNDRPPDQILVGPEMVKVGKGATHRVSPPWRAPLSDLNQCFHGVAGKVWCTFPNNSGLIGPCLYIVYRSRQMHVTSTSLAQLAPTINPTHLTYLCPYVPVNTTVFIQLSWESYTALALTGAMRDC